MNLVQYSFPRRGNSKYKGPEATLKNSIGARGYGVLEVIGGCITGAGEPFIRPLGFHSETGNHWEAFQVDIT